MRKFTTTIAMMIAMALSLFAQIPQTMSYQAVVRNAENALVVSQSVSIELSILQGSDDGTAVYTETHNVTTNANGLITLEMGAGESSDDFSAIDWSAGPYFVKTVAEINGKQVSGVSPMLVVPYAKYAETAGNVPDMSEYAKKSDIPADVDLSNYATKDEIPSLADYAKKSELPELSNYATKDEIPEIDLTGYAKKEDIPSLEGYAKTEDIPAPVDLSEYAKKSEIPAEVDLSEYAKKSEIPTPVDMSEYAKLEDIPAPVDLSEYAKTEDIPSLEGYAKTEDIPAPVDMSEYAKKSDIPAAVDLSDYAKKSDIPSLEGYAKTEDIPAPVDLSDYAKKSDIPAAVDLSDYAKKSDIPSLEGYAKTEDIPTPVDLSDYAKKSDIPAAVDLSDYAKKSDIPSLDGYAKAEDIPSLDGYAKTTDIPSLEGYAKAEDIPSLEGYAKAADIPSLEGYAKTTDIPSLKGYAKTTDIPSLDGYAKAADIPSLDGYAKTTDIPSLDGYAKTTELTDYAKKSEMPAAVDMTEYAKKSDVNLEGYYSKEEVDLMLAALRRMVTGELLQEGLIKGVFSTSDTTKVCFSQGNLQYQASTNTWRFAENQYDIIGDDNNNISATYTGWIDLFTYGSSGYNGADPYRTTWLMEKGSVESISGTNYDWGVYNAISNGGKTAGVWRTLTFDEWRYLIQRSLHCHATVNGVAGMMLLPDNWPTPVDPISAGSDNVYSTSEWATMEANGAVFLPAAGSVNASLNNVGTRGLYWMATAWYTKLYAGVIEFWSDATTITVGDSDYGSRASVRLVQDVKNN